ncbi:predicted protein [Sclerotinia sclerotiorum 1980 UF-70]|uniref:Uncharacterized protein n=1 Tax=Sclerotinia sclerotiorum (strain ATCC 18683 / 1980 / Ss-1) TaxID=665079 RepID=A7ETA0_SCLS1|nr:predicted protein [Sclerotinia sclerotiorum 1980 UF-70]EDN92692.1 predicted protein [Sclerotinia sclerotiorum 1980 UF-70]
MREWRYNGVGADEARRKEGEVSRGMEWGQNGMKKGELGEGLSRAVAIGGDMRQWGKEREGERRLGKDCGNRDSGNREEGKQE